MAFPLESQFIAWNIYKFYHNNGGSRSVSRFDIEADPKKRKIRIVMEIFSLLVLSGLGMVLVILFALEYRNFRRNSDRSYCPPLNCREAFQSPYFSVIKIVPNYWIGGLFYLSIFLCSLGLVFRWIPETVSPFIFPIAVIVIVASLYLFWALIRERLSCRICVIANSLNILIAFLLMSLGWE